MEWIDGYRETNPQDLRVVVQTGRPRSSCCSCFPVWRQYEWRDVYSTIQKAAPYACISHAVSVEDDDKKVKVLIMRGDKTVAKFSVRIKKILDKPVDKVEGFLRLTLGRVADWH